MKRRINLLLASVMLIGTLSACKSDTNDSVIKETEKKTTEKEVIQESQKEEFVEKEITLTEKEKTELSLFVGAISWFGGYMLSNDEAQICLDFALNSLHEVGSEYDMIINNYEGAYIEDYYLCLSEENLKKYLKDSIGYDDITLIKKYGTENAKSGDWNYYLYDGSVYKMTAPDTGDYSDEPQITEAYAISEDEIRISGTIQNYVAEDMTTTLFEISFSKNDDSIWGGYTMSELTKWETYVIPDSDSVYLTQEDLAERSKDDLYYARNEIYARHGYIFKDETLKAYFENQTWYNGTVAEVPESEFNEFEKANIELILLLESDAHLYKYQKVDSQQYYGVSGGESIIITSYLGENESIVDVPETIEGLPVIAIGNYAFQGHKELIQVNLPDSVIILEECPFEYCSNLQVIDMRGVAYVDTFPPTLRGLDSLETIYVGQAYLNEVSFDHDKVEFVDILPRLTYHAQSKTWTSAVNVVRY